MNYMQSQEYLEYLIRNCGVRGCDFQESDKVCKRPDVDIILNYLDWLEIDKSDNLLEVGCGLGRILKEIHDLYDIFPNGVDSYKLVVEEARKRVEAICEKLSTGSAEKMDSPDACFDKILCWGVFDLTNQEEALREMARVLKTRGLLLLTGKNDLYHKDDEEAIVAEQASRKKGIPNHYTDFDALIEWSNKLGLTALKKRFFSRRGDFVGNIYREKKPARFYEYVILFRRDERHDLQGLIAPEVGRKVSRTFEEAKRSANKN